MRRRIPQCSSRKTQTKLLTPYLSGRRRAPFPRTALIVHDTFRQCRRIQVEAEQRQWQLWTISWLKVARTSPERAMQLRKFRARSTRNRGPFLPFLPRASSENRESVPPELSKTSCPAVSPEPDTTRNGKCQ